MCVHEGITRNRWDVVGRNASGRPRHDRLIRSSSKGRIHERKPADPGNDVKPLAGLGIVGVPVRDAREQPDHHVRNEQFDIDENSEGQSLASCGLDFMTNTYLPKRLDETNVRRIRETCMICFIQNFY